jgi:hypothetical protein
MTTNQSEREWIKVGPDPLRYEYGRKNENPLTPAIKDQLAFVEEEQYSSYFHWETYTGHDKGSEPSLEEAQEAAIEALRNEGSL